MVTRSAPWSAVAGSAAVAVAPITYRTGVAPEGVALLLLAAGFLVLAISAIVLAVRMARGAGMADRTAAVALAVALLVGFVPARALLAMVAAPPIHDITTDTENPPRFVAAVALNAPGRTDYGGAALAEQQRAAYPDLQPVMLPDAPADAFGRALAAVERMGWAPLASDPDSLRIEATARTFWFGFEDDVVIRIEAAGESGSLVDVRSLSRVGVSDLGANARRVRAFLATLAEK